MPRASHIQNNFTGGEVGGRLATRSDLEKYFQSALIIENLVTLPQGGLTRRGGSRFAHEVKDSTKKVRLTEFESPSDITYILEGGENYIRFYKDRALLFSSGPFAEEFAVEFDAAQELEVVTTYTEAELFEFQFAQDGDVMYIVHANHPPAALTRTSELAWAIADLDLDNGPFADKWTDGTTTLAPSATTGTITIAASASLFAATDVGRLVEITHGATIGWARITVFTTDILVTAVVISDFGATTAQLTWRLGAFYAANYPRTVGLFEQRLWFGGTVSVPQTLFGSRTAGVGNGLLDFEEGTADDNALNYETFANKIQWLSSGKILTMGATNGEFIVSASSFEEAITPTNIRIVRQAKRRSAFIMPQQVGPFVLFIQRALRKIRALVFDGNRESFDASNMSLLADQALKGGVTQTGYQQEPDGIHWSVRADGQLVGMTFEAEQKIAAFHRQILGGDSDAAGADAKIESVAIGSDTGITGRDDIYISVLRWVNGAAARYVEVIGAGLDEEDDLEDSFFVDSGITQDVPVATTIVGGMSHLVGESVAILADGAVQPNKTVNASGFITLDRAALKTHAGLHRRAKIETLNIEAGSIDGTALGKIGRIHKGVISFYRTVGGKFGSDEDNLELIPFRSTGDMMDTAVPLFTGTKEAKMPSGHDTEKKVVVIQDQPLPMTILAIAPTLRTNN